MYLPDTNIYIYGLLKEKPYSDLLEKWYSKKELAISTISIAEYLAKVDSEDQKIFDDLLSFICIFPVNISVARQAALYRKQSLQKKKKVFLLDCMLAATAKVYNCTFVTVNTSDFPMKDIKVIDPGL